MNPVKIWMRQRRDALYSQGSSNIDQIFCSSNSYTRQELFWGLLRYYTDKFTFKDMLENTNIAITFL